jgi:hypothetical protein
MLKAIITFIVFTISFTLSMNHINEMAFSVIEQQEVSYNGVGNLECSGGKHFNNGNLSFTGFRNNHGGQLYGSFEIYFKDAYNSTLTQGGVLDRGNIDHKGFSIEGLVMSDTLCNNTAPKTITINGDCEKVSVANMKIQEVQTGSFAGEVICPNEKEPGSPVAEASGPSEVIGGQEVVLDASNSYDPDRDELTFSWRQIGGPDVELSYPDQKTARFKAPVMKQNISLMFEATVTDVKGEHDEDEVQIFVRNFLKQPLINATANNDTIPIMPIVDPPIANDTTENITRPLDQPPDDQPPDDQPPDDQPPDDQPPDDQPPDDQPPDDIESVIEEK